MVVVEACSSGPAASCRICLIKIGRTPASARSSWGDRLRQVTVSQDECIANTTSSKTNHKFFSGQIE
jgi:hypothetical protein